MSTALEQLKQHTTVVADTGDFQVMKEYLPQDATTNPSLILAAFGKAEYSALVDDAIAYGRAKHADDEHARMLAIVDKLCVNFGVEILRIVPGRVSTEIDARLAFNAAATVARARVLAALYREAGVDVGRVLFKVAATWEGLQAAKQLEAEGLHCNLTLLFSLPQAVVAAENGVTLISPFAGRITDFYKARDKVDAFEPSVDPGVVSVRNIYNYYKKYGYSTQVMGASFRTMMQVVHLAGCDLLTISPALLNELLHSSVPVERRLTPEAAKAMDIPRIPTDEASFRWLMNEDEMATFKLAEGIRKFAADTVSLEGLIRKRLQ